MVKSAVSDGFRPSSSPIQSCGPDKEDYIEVKYSVPVETKMLYGSDLLQSKQTILVAEPCLYMANKLSVSKHNIINKIIFDLKYEGKDFTNSDYGFHEKEEVIISRSFSPPE
ncbi:hypothetical protein CEXT_690801 [Caerostris extrusa]|uniref:Uncharacterized protein n=1 Tax=Caerostris extrusa TaxID=172846 RepID=A0AAV4Y7W2_CAEEX|nr:hypothetical protein CEXT_690801 [Caerostris extrusa]